MLYKNGAHFKFGNQKYNTFSINKEHLIIILDENCIFYAAQKLSTLVFNVFEIICCAYKKIKYIVCTIP